jgi:hypothetical protein
MLAIGANLGIGFEVVPQYFQYLFQSALAKFMILGGRKNR